MADISNSVELCKDFGRHPNFQSQDAQLLVDVPPDLELAKQQWAVRRQVSVGTQAAPVMSAHEVNADAAVLNHRGMNHTEGGWPREVDPTDAEATARWRKRVERDEDYIKSVVRLGAVVEELVEQNNAIDIYEEYFAGLPPTAQLCEPPSVRTLASLRDPTGACRSVQALAWSPEDSGHLAVAYADASAGNSAAAEAARCAVWDVSSPITPSSVLAASSPLLCLAHNLKDPALLGAGHEGGQFVLFDLRKGAPAVDATPAEVAHRGPLTGLAWTQSKSGTEFMTTGVDGTVVWWDRRKLSERLDSAILRERGSAGAAAAAAQPAPTGAPGSSSGEAAPPLGACCLEYSAAAGPTRFMVGTIQGPILTGNRRAKTPVDRVTSSFPGHHGPVRSLTRNPFFPKYFLSVGDWTARLWSDDVRAPLVATPYRSAYLAAGTWSPSRASVVFAVGSEGRFEAWDLLQSHSAPVLSASISDGPLTALAMHEGAGGVCGVGCADGSATVLQVSAGLAEQQDEERAAFAAILERECGRERALERGAKEAKARARKEAARAAEPVGRMSQEELERLEAEFHTMVAQD